MANSFSEKYSEKDANELKQKLDEAGFIPNQVQYSLWSKRGENVVATYYKSGKLLVQGGGTQAFLAKYINSGQISLLEVPKKQYDDISHDFDCWVGTDESGKGDYFGPLVIAGVLINEKNKALLEEAGICDSKKLNDLKIAKLAVLIKNNAIFSTVVINPAKYNELYEKFQNLNKMLAWGHARAIENILEKEFCPNVISDKFGNESLIKNALIKEGKKINLIQKVKGERDLAVAAASIIARDEFVKRMDALEKKHGVELSKGASEKVLFQAKNAKAKGILLKDIAKLHFKVTQKV